MFLFIFINILPNNLKGIFTHFYHRMDDKNQMLIFITKSRNDIISNVDIDKNTERVMLNSLFGYTESSIDMK